MVSSGIGTPYISSSTSQESVPIKTHTQLQQQSVYNSDLLLVHKDGLARESTELQVCTIWLI